MIWKARWNAIMLIAFFPCAIIGGYVGIPLVVTLFAFIALGILMRIVNTIKIAVTGRPIFYDHKIMN
jgi:hypothetical protein